MADSFDEELELEIDDDRLDKLVVGLGGQPGADGIDRGIYFKELFRLQGGTGHVDHHHCEHDGDDGRSEY